MLAIEQIKFIEYVVTGHTISEACKEIGIAANTGRGWLRNPEVLEELSRATEVFSKEVLKARSRQYRIIQRKILDKIIEKIDEDQLSGYAVDDLIKMLDKSVLTMRNDEDTRKVPHVAIQNNTLNINNNLQDKFQKEEFVKKFSELLVDMDPNDIQSMAEAKEKADREAQGTN